MQKRKLVADMTNLRQICGYNYPIGYLGKILLPFLGKQVQAMGPCAHVTGAPYPEITHLGENYHCAKMISGVFMLVVIRHLSQLKSR